MAITSLEEIVLRFDTQQIHLFAMLIRCFCRQGLFVCEPSQHPNQSGSKILICSRLRDHVCRHPPPARLHLIEIIVSLCSVGILATAVYNIAGQAVRGFFIAATTWR
jgi:hypothetical protein